MAVRIGGQAVIEGVMMKNMDRYAVSVRKPNGKIETKVEEMRNASQRNIHYLQLPVFSRNGKFPGIYGDRDEDTELFCIFFTKTKKNKQRAGQNSS